VLQFCTTTSELGSGWKVQLVEQPEDSLHCLLTLSHATAIDTSKIVRVSTQSAKLSMKYVKSGIMLIAVDATPWYSTSDEVRQPTSTCNHQYLVSNVSMFH